jgi:hypothetical protein
MSGLQNLIQKSSNLTKGRGFKTHDQRKRSKAANQAVAATDAKDLMFQSAQLPDEESIRRMERRKAARRRSARAQTILTDRDTLG